MIIAMILMVLLCLALVVLTFIIHWKVYEKAGQPGWAVFIPIYNFIVLLKIVNKPWWWLFLMIIPIANIIFLIIILSRLSKSFGKGDGFTVGLFFLNIIFWGILAFGDSVYTKIEDAPATT